MYILIVRLKGYSYWKLRQIVRKINIREDKLLFYHCLLELGTQKVNVSEQVVVKMCLFLQKRVLSPNLRAPNLRFNPGFTPLPCYITNAGDEPRVYLGFAS
jgi:hypothetical protein